MAPEMAREAIIKVKLEIKFSELIQYNESTNVWSLARIMLLMPQFICMCQDAFPE